MSDISQPPLTGQAIAMMGAANATNGTQPHIVTGIAASSKSPAEAVTNAKGAAQVTNVNTVIDSVQNESSQVQRQWWGGLTRQAQDQYTSAGYKPPAQHRSLLGTVEHYAVGDTVGSAGRLLNPATNLRGVEHALSPSRNLHGAENAMGAGLRAEQHVVRAGLATPGIGNPNATEGMEQGSIKNLFSINDWERAWDETTNGQQFIEPGTKAQALKLYGQQTYGLALQLAQGKTAQQILAQYTNDPTTQQQIANQLNGGAPKLQDAVNLLNAGHLSFGRALVGTNFIAKHPQAGNLLSGAADATNDWFGDPLNIAGGAVGEAAKSRAAAAIVQHPSDVQAIFDGMPEVQRGMADIAEHVAAIKDGSGTVSTLMSRHPTLNTAAIADMIQNGTDTTDKVLKWFKDQAAMRAVITGDPANGLDGARDVAALPKAEQLPFKLGDSLPRLTRTGQARLLAKGALQRKIDFAADAPFRGLEQDIGDGDLADPLGFRVAGPRVTQTLGGKAARLKGFGQFARRATVLVPQTKSFDLNAPNALDNIRDISLQFLSRDATDKVLLRYASTADLGARRNIYEALMKQYGKAAGLDKDPNIWDTYMGQLTQQFGRKYAPGDLDRIELDGQQKTAGLLKAHMSNSVTVPDYLETVKQGRRALGVHSLIGAVNRPWMDKYMSFWRPLVLAHEGFVRAGGEEAAGFMLRHGPLQYVKAAAARSVMKSLEDVDEKAPGMIWRRLGSHLPAATQDSIHNMSDLLQHYLVDTTRRAMSDTGKALAPDEYKEALEVAARHGVLDPDGAFREHFSAREGYDTPLDEIGSHPNQVEILNERGQLLPADVRPTGAYKGYRNTDDEFDRMWAATLERIASDDWGREALSHAPHEAADGSKTWGVAGRVQRVKQRLLGDQVWHDAAERSLGNRAGQSVAKGEITVDQAAEDHAQALIRFVDRMTGSLGRKAVAIGAPTEEDPEAVQSLRKYLLDNGHAPSLEALQDVKGILKPTEVTGPTLVPVAKSGLSRLNKMTNGMFSRFIAPQMDWISRQPMFIHAYSDSWQQYKPMIAYLTDEIGMSPENAEQIAHDSALDAAFKEVTKYIHNPHLRSQMSVLTRNISPFWFAQEQFYKRWARTFTFAPAAFRKAQLVNSGVRHSGLVSRDPTNGQEYFNYPGAPEVQRVLSDTLGRFMSGGSALPISAGLTGQVNMLNPGLERVGLPSFGPIFSVPMSVLKQLDPHFTTAINTIMGPIAGSEGYLSQVLPTTVVHTLDAAFPQLDSSQYASAQLQAIQYLEATGHGMSFPAVTQVASKTIPHPQAGDYVQDGPQSWVYQPDGDWELNNPKTMDTYMQRVKNWSRIFLITRGLFGFAAPAAPESQFNPDNLSNELQSYMQEMPFDEALSTFMERNPDATPMTVFETQSQSGGTIPATKAAQQFIDSHQTLFSQHPYIASYLIPTADTKGNFDDDAYQEQLAEGLRTKKDATTYYEQIVYQQAAKVYYAAESNYYNDLAENGKSTAAENAWTQQSNQFLAANPIFAQFQASNGPSSGLKASGAQGRVQIMQDLGGALSDGTAPSGTNLAPFQQLYSAWLQWQDDTGGTGGATTQNTVSTEQKTQIDEQFAVQLSQFMQQNPSVVPLVQTAIQPDLDTALEDLAEQGTVLPNLSAPSS